MPDWLGIAFHLDSSQAQLTYVTTPQNRKDLATLPRHHILALWRSAGAVAVIQDAARSIEMLDDVFNDFRKHVNDDEKLSRFVEACARRLRSGGHLAYWQDVLWKRFVDGHCQYRSMDEASVMNKFNLSHVHFLPLVDAMVPTLGAYNVDFSPEYSSTIVRHAPYSADYLVGGRSGGTGVTQHCESCIIARDRIDREQIRGLPMGG